MASSKPQAFPYDHLFKLLMIGDAAVGKVRARWLPGSLEGIVSVTDFESSLDHQCCIYLSDD